MSNIEIYNLKKKVIDGLENIVYNGGRKSVVTIFDQIFDLLAEINPKKIHMFCNNGKDNDFYRIGFLQTLLQLAKSHRKEQLTVLDIADIYFKIIDEGVDYNKFHDLLDKVEYKPKETIPVSYGLIKCSQCGSIYTFKLVDSKKMLVHEKHSKECINEGVILKIVT